jgi:hypothetical protein
MYMIDTANYQEVFLILAVLYFTTAIQCFASWFKRFKRDTRLSRAEKHLCLKVLAIATIFWPIVLPLCSLEKRIFSSPCEEIFWY